MLHVLRRYKHDKNKRIVNFVSLTHTDTKRERETGRQTNSESTNRERERETDGERCMHNSHFYEWVIAPSVRKWVTI